MIDRILYNGKIYTQDSRHPFVSALAIHNGRVVAIGADDAILALAHAHTHRDNLQGKTVLPGLTDSHIHFEWLSRSLQTVDLFEVPSLAEALSRVKAQVAHTPMGAWVIGRGWWQALWGEGTFPTARDLDAVAPHHPCYFSAKSGHAGWVNSEALRVCGITASTPDPEGGQIVRDRDGNPTGILLETAMELVSRHVPDPTPDQLATYMADAQQQLLASGLTGFHDFDNPTCLASLQILRERGQLALRVTKQINRAWLDSAIASGIRSGFGDFWLRIGALKLFADGALGPKTAFMVEPYEGEPNNYGIEVLTQEEMTASVSKASAFGLASTVHAIGDRAVHRVLNVFETVRQEERARGETRLKRHRIEHVQIIHPDDKTRLRDLALIASMQPMHATSDYPMAERYWGDRCQWAYNPRLQLDLGVKVAFGSDSPVEPFAPLLGIHAAITRQRNAQPSGGWYPEARLTLEEAIHGFTLGASYATGLETHLGKLSEGYLADCVVLERDIFTIGSDEIAQLGVVATMTDGEWRYGEL